MGFRWSSVDLHEKHLRLMEGMFGTDSPNNSDMVSLPIIPENKPPRVAHVTIEEVEGDLEDGANKKTFKDISFTPPVYRGSKRASPSNSAVVLGNSEQKITIDSYCRHEDFCVNTWDVWTMLYSNGVGIAYSQTETLANANNKLYKVSQEYTIKYLGETVRPRYLQFVCSARKVKYLGKYFKKGEVITLFVRRTDDKDLPSPPMISIQPNLEHAFVPLQPGQKLQVVTDSAKDTLDWRRREDSALIIRKEFDLNNDASKLIGSKIRCYVFECVSKPEVQEMVFVSETSGRFRTICIPVLGNRDKNPVIIDPTRSFVLYSHNIDGFSLRSYKKKSISIDKNCPLRLVYTVEMKDYHESKIAIEKPTAAFEITRDGDGWLAKVY